MEALSTKATQSQVAVTQLVSSLLLALLCGRSCFVNLEACAASTSCAKRQPGGQSRREPQDLICINNGKMLHVSVVSN